jgi:hypothetical protein
MTTHPEAKRNFVLSEAMILASIPPIAYGLTYANGAAFCAALSVPLDFVAVDANTVISFGIALVLFCAVLVFVINELPLPIRRRKSRFGRAARRAKILFAEMLTIAIVAALPWLLNAPGGQFPLFAIIIYGMAVAVAKWADFSRRIRAASDQRPARSYRLPAKGARRHIPLFLRVHRDDRGLSRDGIWRLVFASLVLILFSLANAAGYAEAQRADWLVLNTSPERVLISKTGDELVTVTFNRKDRTIGDDFLIIKEDKDVTMVLSDIGRLRRHPGRIQRAGTILANAVECAALASYHFLKDALAKAL